MLQYIEIQTFKNKNNKFSIKNALKIILKYKQAHISQWTLIKKNLKNNNKNPSGSPVSLD